jgi:hypothetical protein
MPHMSLPPKGFMEPPVRSRDSPQWVTDFLLRLLPTSLAEIVLLGLILPSFSSVQLLGSAQSPGDAWRTSPQRVLPRGQVHSFLPTLCHPFLPISRVCCHSRQLTFPSSLLGHQRPCPSWRIGHWSLRAGLAGRMVQDRLPLSSWTPLFRQRPPTFQLRPRIPWTSSQGHRVRGSQWSSQVEASERVAWDMSPPWPQTLLLRKFPLAH